MCQCRLTDLNKHTSQVSDADSGGGCAYVGAGAIWEFSVSSTQFCCEPKSTLKIKVY